MSKYELKDGLRYTFEKKCFNDPQKTDEKQFPVDGNDDFNRFVKVEELMNEKYHPSVNLGAAISDNQLLTDHGVDHIKSVCAHAKEILSNDDALTGFELFILLMAIHFHDVGNIEGREGHEKRIEEIMNEIGDVMDLQMPEREYVTVIATAHGGTLENGNKDTIGAIKLDDVYGGVKIRPKALAAILRFADEISDDLTRSQFKNITIPTENMVYHEYSKALSPISIVGNTIKFHYNIYFENTQNKLGKGSKKVFLYDEIISRLGKCMREFEYCSKYAEGLIKITTVDVTIDCYKKGNSYREKDSFSFRMSLQGYPDEKDNNIYKYLVNDDGSATLPKLKYTDGNVLSKAMREE